MDLLRSTDGHNPYRGRQFPVRPDRPVTKWDLISDAERVSLLGMRVSPHGPTYCNVCQADVSTEDLFWQHFTLPDLRYWNLGDCPNSEGSWLDS